MKVTVTYMSLSGNTKQVAEAIFDALDTEKELSRLYQVANLNGCDLAFVGAPVMHFGPPAKAERFLEQHCRGKRIALFVTHAAPEDCRDLNEWLARFRQAASDADIVGVFNCQGELAEPVMGAMARSLNPQLRLLAARGHETRGQPDAGRLEKARTFARTIVEKERAQELEAVHLAIG
jgi:hypothetical protein